MIGFRQVPPKDSTITPYAADPLGRDPEKQQAQIPPEQYGEVNDELPGDLEEMP